MNEPQTFSLICKVVEKNLEQRIRESQDYRQLIRFDGLDKDCLTAILNHLAQNELIKSSAWVQVCRSLVNEDEIHEQAFLTDKNAAFIRNACPPNNLTFVVTANPASESTIDTLKLVDSISDKTICEMPGWLDDIKGLTNNEQKVTQCLLKGLIEAFSPKLKTLEAFVLEIQKLRASSLNIDEAVNRALPKLGLPRSINEIRKNYSKKTNVKGWVTFFGKAFAERSHFFSPKARPSGQFKEHFETLKEKKKELFTVDSPAYKAYESAINDPNESPFTNLLDFEWEQDDLKDFLLGVKLERTKSIAQETRRFFEREHNDLLAQNAPSRISIELADFFDLLDDFVASKSKDIPEEFFDFFDRYQKELSANKPLYKQWDKLIYKDPIESQDFVSGLLLAVNRLLKQEEYGDISDYKICITYKKSIKNIYSDLNSDARAFFGLMYKGLQAYSDIFEWKISKTKKRDSEGNPFFVDSFEDEFTENSNNKSLKSDALKLQFSIGLIPRASLDEKPQGDILLIWTFPKSSIVHNLGDDFSKLLKSRKDLGRILFCHSGRVTNRKGAIGTISLDEPQQLGTDNHGHLLANINTLKLCENLNAIFERLRSDHHLESGHPLVQAWNQFFDDYYIAVKAFNSQGLVAPEIDTCVQSYQALLEALDTLEDVSTQRQPFFALVSSIGVYTFVDVSNTYAIVPPWNPMRLGALKSRFMSRLNLIRDMMSTKGFYFDDNKSVFLQYLTEESPQYLDPQVVSAPDIEHHHVNKADAFGQNWVLLKGVQFAGGYSLFTLAASDQNVNSRQVGSSQAVITAAQDAIAAYLKLYPHEKDNLVVALPDVAGADLPVDLANVLYERYLKDNGEANLPDPRFTIQVGGLTSDEITSAVFEDLNGDATDTDAFHSMAMMGTSVGSALRLRSEAKATFMKQKSNAMKKKSNCHIAIVDRLLANNSTVTWQTIETSIYDPMKISSMPELTSRRYFDYQNPNNAKTFIVTPDQTAVGAQYLRVLAYIITNDQNKINFKSDTIRLPCIQISTKEIQSSLQSVHEIAEWVLICNDLIDKRQLLDLKIKVVRYKVDRMNHRTEILSSNLLINQNHLKAVLEPVLPPNCNLEKITNKLVDSSYEISGLIALRAARREVNARELVGLTLSRYALEQKIRQLLTKYQQQWLISATYLLDDYGAWFDLLGLEYLADLLMLVVSKDRNDHIHLHIWVTEAKFVSESIQNESIKKSSGQLLRTVDHIEKMLQKGTQSGKYDRQIWLHRLADLLLDTPRVFHNEELLKSNGLTQEIKEIAKCIRLGQTSITLNGVSHIFTHDLKGDMEVERKLLEHNRCYQEVYCEQNIKVLLHSIATETITSQVSDIGNFDFTNVSVEAANADDVQIIQKAQEHLEQVTVNTVEVTTLSKEDDVSACLTELADQKKNEWKALSAPVVECFEQEDVEVIEQTSELPTSSKVLNHEPTQSQRYAPGFEEFVLEQAKDNEYSQERQQWADQVTRNLTRKLLQKDIRAIEIGHQVTPNGCLIRYRGDDSLTTKAIKALEENLMTTESVKIVFARAALGEFQILVESPTREAISMWAIWKNRSVHRSASGVNLKFAIGLKETDNHILYLSPIEQDPHTLIAGGTGSGKTILAHMLLLDIVATNPSSKMKFYLIDPKKAVDFGPFKRLPHLAAPQITSKEEAIALLKELLAEMNHRLELFESVGAKNLERYNAKVSKDKRLPVLWLVHDEVASWMVDKEYEKMISETLTVLTVQARATGIYLILITQRPDKDVIPMQIRDNLGNRLALKLPTEQSSVIALGSKGAEVLLGKGHLAAKLNNEIIYAQVPFLNEDNDEIQKAIDKIIEFDAQWC